MKALSRIAEIRSMAEDMNYDIQPAVRAALHDLLSELDRKDGALMELKAPCVCPEQICNPPCPGRLRIIDKAIAPEAPAGEEK